MSDETTGSASGRRASSNAAAAPVRGASRRRLPRTLPARSRLLAAGALAATAAVVLVLVLATGGGASAPTVLQASRVGLGAPTGGAPAESHSNPHALDVSAAGIAYPYWGGKLGWRAVGARTDTVGGRVVTTVLYADRRGRRIGYSIVAGSALAIPAGNATVVRRGRGFHVLNRADPTIVTWRENGHTCILTARGVDAGELIHLATWQRV